MSDRGWGALALIVVLVALGAFSWRAPVVGSAANPDPREPGRTDAFATPLVSETRTAATAAPAHLEEAPETAPTPLSISGVVQDARGASLAAVSVYVRGVPRWTTRTGSDGRFRLELDPGRWTLGAWAGHDDTFSSSPLLEVEAGTVGVTLVCPDRARLEARLAGGEVLTAGWARRTEAPWCFRRMDGPRPRFRCATLEPGIYEVVLQGAGGRFAYVRDARLRAGETTRLVLEPLPGARLRLVVEAGVTRVEARHEGIRVLTSVFGPGDPRERWIDVPAGRLVLRAGDLAADGEVFGPPIERWLGPDEEDELVLENYSWK